MNPTIKISYTDFKRYAILGMIEHKFIPNNVKPETIQFMKSHGYESDSQCYEIPDYIELELEVDQPYIKP